MSLAKKFPSGDGWIRQKATLTSSEPLDEEEMKNLATFGKPENYEFGHIEQTGNKLLSFTREKPEVQAAREKVAMDAFFDIVREAAKPFNALVNATPAPTKHYYTISVKVGAGGSPYKFLVHEMAIFTDFHKDHTARELEKMRIEFIEKLPKELIHEKPPEDRIVPAEKDPDPAYRPLQPIYTDKNGHRRFRENAIVSWLLDAGPFDMNVIAATPFAQEDRVQFASLIGYSLSGFGELSYVKDHHYGTAAELDARPEGYPEDAARAIAAEEAKKAFRDGLKIPLLKLIIAWNTTENPAIKEFLDATTDGLSTLYECHPEDLVNRLQQPS